MYLGERLEMSRKVPPAVILELKRRISPRAEQKDSERFFAQNRRRSFATRGEQI